MPDIDISGLSDAVRLAWELIASIRGGTYFQGDICNETQHPMELKEIYEWQGNFYDGDHTLDLKIDADRADVFLHGTSGGLDGAFSAAVYRCGPVDILVGGWITNSALGKKMVATQIAENDGFSRTEHDIYWSDHWYKNHDVPAVRSVVVDGSTFTLATQMTNKEIDPPRWGGHWQLGQA